MTQDQVKQAENDAMKEAERMSLVLLLLFRQKRGFQGRQITYDASSGRFRIDGRLVSISSIRAQLLKVEDRLGWQLLKITNELEANQISFAQWKREFERTISTAHILAAAFVLGSISAAVNNRRVQQQIDEQWRFSDNFAEELRRKAIIPRRTISGLSRVVDGSLIPPGNFFGLPSEGKSSQVPPVKFRGISMAKIRSRAKSYVRAAHITFANVELEVYKTLDFYDEARRVLRAAEHCRDTELTPGCLELAAQGWMPVDQMTPIGDATCMQWCRCYIEYR